MTHNMVIYLIQNGTNNTTTTVKCLVFVSIHVSILVDLMQIEAQTAIEAFSKMHYFLRTILCI